ncbi:phage antirepressor KilAC domain-containing protein [Oscillibacter sp.]|uniref:phage antirepressor KilAC domain-containing protein n=1 Tax=Oscillibacter sp. TaxID=1945593 RepID=UPI00289C047E|nr:phage antirepressor KilAC domain-containing protein [Oscillibacter sp.]
MNELIKVTYDNDRPLVSARELHGFLEVETPYRKWFPRMCEYGFSENQDFSVADIFVHNSGGGPQSQKDAALSLDMAKELCMLQRNEKGKQARQYFIQLEKDWNSPEKVMARALQIADRRIRTLETENAIQKQAIADFEPIRQYIDAILESPGAMATTQIAADYNMSARKLNAILNEEGIQRNVNGQWILYRRHMGKGYTKSKTFSFVHTDGRPDTKPQTQWTQKGRLMIHELLSRRGIKADMDAKGIVKGEGVPYDLASD